LLSLSGRGGPRISVPGEFLPALDAEINAHGWIEVRRP
jgi:hypothetical protein